MTNTADFKAWLKNPKSGELVYGRDFDQGCQALVYQTALEFGVAVQVYPSAAAAMRASGKLNKDWTKAPVGAIHYWYGGNLPAAGHDGVELEGGGKGVGMGTGRSAGKSLGNGVRICTVPQYTATGALYAGWSINNGKNRVLFEAEPVKETMEETQRKTGKKTVTRREGPGKLYKSKGKPLAADTVGNFVAYARGPKAMGQPEETNVWYQGTSGDWFYAGDFTAVSGKGLKVKTTQFAKDTPASVYPPVKPPVVVPPVVIPEPEPEPTPDPTPTPVPEDQSKSDLRRFVTLAIPVLTAILTALAALLPK